MSKAQASVEYILISAFIIMIVLPILFFSYKYSDTSKKEVIASRVQDIGITITDTAEAVYYMGAPARITVTANMPEGISNLSIVGTTAKELLFTLEDGTELAYASLVNITGPYNATGDPCPAICYASGEKRIIILADQQNVNITIL
ncbi:hypothetical protein HZB01_02380 [Candidatus Woesearchaeota archaeon]|nr:hypothetical protein [Candidatus Woesearchaeota archaeon]